MTNAKKKQSVGLLPVLLVLSRLHPLPDLGPPGREAHVRKLWHTTSHMAAGRRRSAGHGTRDEIAVIIQPGGFLFRIFFFVGRIRCWDLIVRDRLSRTGWVFFGGTFIAACGVHWPCTRRGKALIVLLMVVNV